MFVYILERLHFAVGVAIFFWLWGWATYSILKYFNEKPIPGIHTGLKEGLAEQTGIKEPSDTLMGKDSSTTGAGQQ